MYDPPSPLRRLRACEPCTKAKARCNFRDENAGKHLCDRCERLGTECAAKTTKVVRRPRQIKKPLVNRIASLEQQLASLVTTDRANAAAETSSASSTSGHEGDQRRCAGDTRFSSTPPFGLSWHQAECILDDFRDLFTPNFPFVVVDRETTPRDLFKEKPFLFRAILLVATPLPRSRAAGIRDEVLAYLSRRMLLEEEQSLDILQGIMVIIMWADIKFFYDKQITRLVYLALGYAHTLNITRIPLSVLATRDAATKQPDDCFSDKLLASLTTHHTLEEQRAFLGLFYAVTVNSSQFARRNPLLQQHATGPGLYVDICCESLARSGDAGDAMAARMARLAQISGRVSEIFGSFANRATGESYSGLCETQATAIRREMDAIAADVDPLDPSSTYVWMQYNALIAQLYETATMGSTSTPLYRTTCLLDCLAAARAFYEAMVSMAPERFLYRTSASMCQAQAVVTATTRLLALEAEGWDLESARASLDFLNVVEQITGLSRRTAQEGRERMRRFADETGGSDADLDEADSRGGSCEELVDKMGWIGDWYRIKLDAEVGKASEEGVSRELLEEISRIWQWSPDTGGVPFFGGLLNPFEVSYEGI